MQQEALFLGWGWKVVSTIADCVVFMPAFFLTEISCYFSGERHSQLTTVYGRTPAPVDTR